ncbi:LOW QUALITY PROTEIN: hypothetical protein CVT25_015205 [Psilocybe cyanescens]|uniref:Uncharacterized protein n=1 Tax=Psilocybe cyanescens TaxID=93625 RepID=A0A409WRL5_PSICY|nr:LOW QUALITY PROTEIN: hypothetical protein CVT25_015205 [Psilocybe cyanescens]
MHRHPDLRVARFPAVYANTDMTRAQARLVRSSSRSAPWDYDNAVKAMMGTIVDLRSIDAWNYVLCRLGELIEGENSKVTERLKEHM